jgi:flagellar protein FliO/FliZ
MYRPLSLLLLPQLAFAAPTLTQDITAVKSWLIASLLIMLIGGLVFLLARKKPLSGFRFREQPIQVISTLSLGMKEKLVLIQVEQQRFLLGVTPQQIMLVSTLEQPPSASEQREPNAFADLMKAAETSPPAPPTYL